MTVTQQEAKPRTLLLVGDAAVGKTALVRRLRDNTFLEEYVCTGGLELHTYTLGLHEGSVNLQVADLAGKEGYCTLLSGFYHAADAVLFVYDVASRESFDHAKFWLKVIQLHAQRDLRMLLLGNKSDLPAPARAVCQAEAQAFADSVGVQLMETSARTGTNVVEAFRAVVQEPKEECAAGGEVERKARKEAQALALRKVLHGLERELQAKDAERAQELRARDEQVQAKSERILALEEEAREKEEEKEVLHGELSSARKRNLELWGELERKTLLLEAEEAELKAQRERLWRLEKRDGLPTSASQAQARPPQSGGALAAATAVPAVADAVVAGLVAPPAAEPPSPREAAPLPPAAAPGGGAFAPPEPSVYDARTEHDVTRVVEYEVPGVQRSDIEVRRQTSGGFYLRIERRRLIDPAKCEAAPGCRIRERHGVFETEWRFGDGFWDFRAEESGVEEGILRLVFRKSLAEETFLFGGASGRFERQARDRVLCEEDRRPASSAAGHGGASTTSSFCIVPGAEAGFAALEGFGEQPP